ncbi:hypothetical protein D9M71_772800 [compost metagenome]
MRVDAGPQGEPLESTAQRVIPPHAQHVSRHITVERGAVQAAVDVVEGLGLGVGVTREQLQSFDHFTADLGLETLGADLARVDIAVAIR